MLTSRFLDLEPNENLAKISDTEVYGDAYLFQMNGTNYQDLGDDFITALENGDSARGILQEILVAAEKQRVRGAGGGKSM